MRVIRRLVQEQVVDDHTFHRRKPRRNVVGVRVRLQDVLTLTIQTLEHALDGGIQHVRDA